MGRNLGWRVSLLLILFPALASAERKFNLPPIPLTLLNSTPAAIGAGTIFIQRGIHLYFTNVSAAPQTVSTDYGYFPASPGLCGLGAVSQLILYGAGGGNPMGTPPPLTTTVQPGQLLHLTLGANYFGPVAAGAQVHCEAILRITVTVAQDRGAVLGHYLIASGGAPPTDPAFATHMGIQYDSINGGRPF